MASQTGRTVGKYIKVQISDSGDTLRDIPVSSIGGVGIDYDEVDLTALQDAVKGVLPGHGNVGIDISGPFDTSAAQAASATTEAAALSGSHTVLQPLNGGTTPLSFAVYYGIRHNWEAGEPVFGGENLFLVTGYKVNDDGTYNATIKLSAGASAPTWGTAAIS
jgi:hypothetical protein